MNKLIKSLAMVAAFGLAASAFADDSYLYWMWDESYTGSDWTYGKIVMSDGSTTTYLTNRETGAENFSDKDGTGLYEEIAKIGSVTLGSNYSFVLELYNSSNQKVGASSALAYSDISGAISTTSIFGGQAKFTGMTVPEPTSGMLALLGLALVGLRRKHA